MKNNIKFEKRPMCSCGVKMKLINYMGYYDSFKYWRCDNCKLDNEIQNIKEDETERGCYA